MKKLLLIGVIAVVLFGTSAGVSWYLRHLQDGKSEHETTALEAEPGHKSPPAHGAATVAHGETAAPASGPAPSPSLPTAVRAPYNPEAESAVQIATSLKQRMDAIHVREEHLSNRQKNLELIFENIRTERAAIDEKRKEVSNLMKAVQEKMATLDTKVNELADQRQQTSKEATELKKNQTDYNGLEKDRIKQVASMYDSMEPASAAKILQTLADTGNMETAVKILGTMRERQAAKVLSELTDPGLAAQLLDKLKGLKKPELPKEALR